MPNEKEMMLEMLETMLRIRRFEERCVTLSSKGKLPGFLHLYIGEEAVATGVCANLQTDDYITSTHRGHGHVIAKGGDVRRMMAELYGKVTGYCKGKGGSMHIADGRLGILGANGIVGGGLQIAAGAGSGLQILDKRQVVVCFFGDGAASQGAFHESVNLASTWKLPVIYVNENNGFAISTDGSRQRNIERIADRAAAYGIPGERIDGNDVLQVYKAANEAVRRAREGEGPSLIECVTWRWRGHSEGDPEHYYRTQEETAVWMEKDPIAMLQNRLIQAQYADQAAFEAINEAVMKEIDDAVDFGEQSAYPDITEVIADVYAEPMKGNGEHA
jgi:pyruvate dehydrogenase E1 component alpha subunit